VKIAAQFLVRLYPRSWRDRYEEEFVALLDHTGIGLKQVSDISLAALRERIHVTGRGVLSPAVSHQVARFAGFYSFAWISVWMLTAMLPSGALSSRLSLFSLEDHRRVLTTFLFSALVSRLVDNWALPEGEGVRVARPTAQAVGTLSSAVAMAVCMLVGPTISVASPLVFVVILSGQWFGRRRSALAALQGSGPAREHRPSSLITLGLGR